MSSHALPLVLVASVALSACAGHGARQTATAPITRIADRDRPTLAIRGDTARCTGDSAVQVLEVRNPTPREVTIAVHSPSGLAPLSGDNLLRPFQKRRYTFDPTVSLTGVSAWTFDAALGIGHNTTDQIDVEPKRSCGVRH